MIAQAAASKTFVNELGNEVHIRVRANSTCVVVEISGPESTSETILTVTEGAELLKALTAAFAMVAA